MREMLGPLVLGALPAPEEVALRAHLDGCAACRADLEELAPLAGDLLLVDPDRTPGPVAPPRELGVRIAAAVGAESVLRERRDRRETRRGRLRTVLVPVAAAAAAAVVTAIAVLPADPPPAAPSVAFEQLPLRPVDPAVSADTATVVPHTWGVEVRLVASGFDAGATYRGVVRTRDGRLLPAGEFLGTGAKAVTCNMQAAVLRTDAVDFTVVDAEGRTVLDLALPPKAVPRG
nr:zf-HC2 domain-containing protein [Kineococcus siccus]